MKVKQRAELETAFAAPPRAAPIAASVAAEDLAPARQPVFHVDFAERAHGFCIVAGWAVRKPGDLLDLAVECHGERRAPLLMLPRPDVIEYMTHIKSPRVGRFDLATGFVFAVPAPSFDGLALLLQGHATPLVARSHREEPGIEFVYRYLDAMLRAPDSPVLDVVSRHFQDIQVAHHARPAAPPSNETTLREATTSEVFSNESARISSFPGVTSSAGLLAACVSTGPLFAGPRPAPLTGRVALLAVHQRHTGMTRSQLAMLERLREQGFTTVLVNSAPGSDAGLAELGSGLCQGLVQRSDFGRDIASWLLTLDLLRGRLDGVEHLLLCNDSFFGPFDCLDALFRQHARADMDVWGLTDSWEQAWHVQSSFLILSQRALRSRAFRHFVRSYGYPNERSEVVRDGEIGLSRSLVAAGDLSLGVLAPYHDLARAWLDGARSELEQLRELPEEDGPPSMLDGEHFAQAARSFVVKLAADLRRGQPRNPQHVFWDQMVTRHHIPFVKKELLLANPGNLPAYHRMFPIIAAEFGSTALGMIEHDMRNGGKLAPVF